MTTEARLFRRFNEPPWVQAELLAGVREAEAARNSLDIYRGDPPLAGRGIPAVPGTPTSPPAMKGRTPRARAGA